MKPNPENWMPASPEQLKVRNVLYQMEAGTKSLAECVEELSPLTHYLTSTAAASSSLLPVPDETISVPIIKLIEIRNLIAREEYNEAYHVLYSLADPAFSELEPWKKWEKLAGLPVGESRWISVEEKLPEEDAAVLAAVPFYDNDKQLKEVEVLHCTYYQGGLGSGQKIFTTCEGEEYEAGDVTHWMSLPKPPELGLGESREPLPQTKTEIGTQEKP